MARQKSQASPSELSRYLGKSGRVLDALGYDDIPTDHNPMWQALAGLSPITEEEIISLVTAGELTESEAESFAQTQRDGAELAESLKPLVWNGGSSPKKRLILTAYVLAQTACLNEIGGAVGTDDLGTIRQRWYFSKLPQAMGFKFASQALEQYCVQSADVVLVDNQNSYDRASRQRAQRIEFKSQWTKANVESLNAELNRTARIHTWPKAGWGRTYAQLQSQILSGLVRSGLTYEQLWVRDASRDIDRNEPLVPNFHGALLLEKQGLFEHLQGMCRAAGIPVLVAMSGNNAFSSVEAIINDSFRDWSGNLKITVENPLHLFVISDHDYYGHVPVQTGAASQFEHYLPDMVVVHRVGITPDQLRDAGRSPAQAGYEFDAEYNAATREWADLDGVWVGNTCYAIEVEALEPSAFVGALIDALVEALGGDEALRDRLAQMAEPDWWKVQETITDQLRKLSELWRRLTALCDWSEETRESDAGGPSENWVVDRIGNDDDDDAWRSQDKVKAAISEKVSEQCNAVDFDAFTKYVKDQAWGTWRPVGSEAASRAVVEIFTDSHDEAMKEFTEGLDWQHEDLLAALRDVFDVLDYHGLEFES